MKTYVKTVLKYKWLVLIVFIVLAIVSIILSKTVVVNYDLVSYLPENANSTKALHQYENLFKDNIPNVKLMLADVSITKALEYKQMIEDTEGVLSVIWLDDSLDITKPLAMYKTEEVEKFYKDNSALFQIAIEEHNQAEILNNLQTMLPENAVISGSAVLDSFSIMNVQKEVNQIVLFLAPIIVILLIVATNSFIEPLILCLAILFGIILNVGTNAFKGEISFVTGAAASLLQMAVSMDYSIFILHRFNEEKQNSSNLDTAIVNAISNSFKSVISSGLTTAIGFFALLLMQFKIGADMGIVLTKGIFFSLFSVFTLLPILLHFFNRLIERTRHKSFIPRFSKTIHCISKQPNKFALVVLMLFVLISGISFLAEHKNSFNYSSSKVVAENSIINKNKLKIEEKFFKDNIMVLLVPDKQLFKSEELLSEIEGLPNYKYNIAFTSLLGSTFPIEMLDESEKSQFFSGNYQRIILSFDLSEESNETFGVVETIRQIASKYYQEDYYLLGESVSTYDMKNVTNADNVKVNFIAVVAILTVMLFVFKSPLLVLLLLLIIETSIWLNMAIPYFFDQPIFFIAFLIISSIQLGATVDYAILFANRYLELRAFNEKAFALAEALRLSGISIITSGLILTVTGVLLGLGSSNLLLSQYGVLIGRGAFLSTLMVLLCLPSLVLLFDKVIMRTTFQFKGE